MSVLVDCALVAGLLDNNGSGGVVLSYTGFLSMHTTATRVSFLVLLAFGILASALPLLATPDIAEKAGQECGYCHIDADGGSKLTEVGKSVRGILEDDAYGRQTQTKPFSWWARLVVKYIHIMSAIFWFGRLLYVHLVLTPSHAAHGIPRTEAAIGLGCMFLLAATGVYLSYCSISDPAMMFATRFGSLLAMKILLFLVMVISALFAVVVLGPRIRAHRIRSISSGTEITEDELSFFDGKDGRPTYLAYRGTVYNVSSSDYWRTGGHAAQHQAGGDLTANLKTAPHGEEVFKKFEVVGTLRMDGAKPNRPWFEVAFLFLAHLNLIILLLIVLILASWRLH
jgi:predicted heme/steroid binding protein